MYQPPSEQNFNTCTHECIRTKIPATISCLIFVTTTTEVYLLQEVTTKFAIVTMQPNLCNVTLHNVTPFLISPNYRERMCSIQISLLVVTFPSHISLREQPHGWGFGWVRVQYLGFKGRIRTTNQKLWEGSKASRLWQGTLIFEIHV